MSSGFAVLKMTILVLYIQVYQQESTKTNLFVHPVSHIIAYAKHTTTKHKIAPSHRVSYLKISEERNSIKDIPIQQY